MIMRQMDSILLFVISILPAIFLLWYCGKYDSSRPEPRHMLWKTFKYGIVATFCAAILEQNMLDYLPSFISGVWTLAFVTAFIVVALVEEFLKFFVVRKIISQSKHFNEIIDGVIYTVTASLGFATLENLFYVFQNGASIGMARALLTVPAHALFSGIMGYYLGKAQMAKLPWEGRNLALKGLALAVLYHGLYNFFLTAGGTVTFLVIPLLILMYFQLQHKIRLAHYEDGLIKTPPAAWDYRRTLRISFGLILVLAEIFYVLGIKMMIETGDYIKSYIPYYIIVAVLIAAGIFFTLRHHGLSKEKWLIEIEEKKAFRKTRKSP